jgi:hypothetical protein
MRTTLVLDDELLRQAKKRAAALNLTVSDVVNRALRDSLMEEAKVAAPFSMVTFGRARDLVHHEPAEFSPASDDEHRMSDR